MAEMRAGVDVGGGEMREIRSGTEGKVSSGWRKNDLCEIAAAHEAGTERKRGADPSSYRLGVRKGEYENRSATDIS